MIPLAVWRARERRARSLRQALRLPEPTPRSRLTLVGALVAVCGLLALAGGPSPLAKKISDGVFAISVEVDPPRGLNPNKMLEGAALIKAGRTRL